MKITNLKVGILTFMGVLFLITACNTEDSNPSVADLSGTTWISEFDGGVVKFYESTWTRNIADENRFYEGNYAYENPPKITFEQLDENGDVELRFEGEVIDENTLEIEGDTYIKQ